MLKVSDISLAFDNSKKSAYELIFMMDERKLLVFHSYPRWLNTALKGRRTSKEMIHITKEDFVHMKQDKITKMTQRIFKTLQSNEP